MKKLALMACAVATASLFAGPNADRPDARHAWAVHDDNRPNPRVVSADEGQVPSDAIVLFDGTQKSVDEHWQDSKGRPTKWEVRDRLFYSTPKSGMVFAKDKFSDCQLHLEFMIPDPSGPGLGNTGVFVGGYYELQILDSYGDKTSKMYPHAPWKNANYADGQMAAVYGQNPPIVNPSRAPGKWQVYDIIFHAARWDGDRLVSPATITAFLNGVLVQDEYKLQGPTWYCNRTKHDSKLETTLMSAVGLQDHGHPVPYRLIWARAIPPRNADTVSGGEHFNELDAKRLSAELAAKTLKLADETPHPESKLVYLWESYAYMKDAAVKARIDEYTPVYIKRVEGFGGNLGETERVELSNMRGFCTMGVRNGLFPADYPLIKAINDAMKRARSKERKF
jgi:hypothetical protein